jgi:4-azaleucine resistance transporter AzlC
MNRIQTIKLKEAAEQTLPVFLGYIPLGAAFGILLVKAGYPWFLAPIMAAVMYAGSGQLLAVSFFSANAGYAEVAVATLLMQLRHSFYGLSLLAPFSTYSSKRFYMMHALTDETYALLTGLKISGGKDGESVCFMISFLDHCYWILGCTLGAVAGTIIPSDMKGLDFALTALFVVLAVEKWRESDTPIPIVTGIVSSVAAVLLCGSENILLGAIGIAVAVLCLYGWRRADARK